MFIFVGCKRIGSLLIMAIQLFHQCLMNRLSFPNWHYFKESIGHIHVGGLVHPLFWKSSLSYACLFMPLAHCLEGRIALEKIWNQTVKSSNHFFSSSKLFFYIYFLTSPNVNDQCIFWNAGNLIELLWICESIWGEWYVSNIKSSNSWL